MGRQLFGDCSGHKLVQADALVARHLRGRLGAAIVDELTWRGADAELLLGDGAWRPSTPMAVSVVRTYDHYRDMVLERVRQGLFAGVFSAGVFSAGVADYRPAAVVDGKLKIAAAIADHLEILAAGASGPGAEARGAPAG